MRTVRIAFVLIGIAFAADHFFGEGALREAVWWSLQKTAWSITNAMERQVATLRP